MAGVLWVSSKIVEPSKLSVKQFDDWYEKEHALEVLSLPGVPSGIRYTCTDPDAPSPYLITYELPDLSYTTSPDFQAVANQDLSQDLIDRIYAHASFDIRFYSEFALPALSPSSPSPKAPSAPAPLLASVAVEPLPGREGDAAIWFAGKFVLELKALRAFVRARRFEFVNGVVRERNVVRVPGKPKWLALIEFDDGAQDVRKALNGVLDTEVAQAEVEWYEVKKMWKEGEVERVGEAP